MTDQKPDKPERKVVPEADLKQMLDRLDEAGTEKGGEVAPLETPSAPSDPPGPTDAMIVREALLAEGLGPQLIARKLKWMLSNEAKTAKWDLARREWVYFIDLKIWKDCIEILIKVFGGYAPEAQINLSIDLGLKDLLLNTTQTPEEANAQFKAYLAKIAHEEIIDVEPTSVSEQDGQS